MGCHAVGHLECRFLGSCRRAPTGRSTKRHCLATCYIPPIGPALPPDVGTLVALAVAGLLNDADEPGARHAMFTCGQSCRRGCELDRVAPPVKLAILTQYYPPEVGAPQSRLAAPWGYGLPHGRLVGTVLLPARLARDRSVPRDRVRYRDALSPDTDASGIQRRR